MNIVDKVVGKGKKEAAYIKKKKKKIAKKGNMPEKIYKKSC